MRINDILKAKGSEVVSLPAETPVRDLVALLTERGIGAVLVSSAGRPVTGIVSERDIVRALSRDDGVLDRTVGDIMTSELVSATPEDTLDDLAKLMTERRIRHVPVFAGDELCGIVSIGDVVKSRIDELEFERDQLESYVGNA